MLGKERNDSHSEQLVAAVLANVSTAPLTEKEKLLFGFIDKVNCDSHRIAADDTAALRSAGWTDEEIYYAISVCAIFNFYNRWIDATGVHALSDEAHRQGGIRSATYGYVRK